MGDPDNLSSFFEEIKPLIGEYVETRLELIRLQVIRGLSQTVGLLVWIAVSAFVFLVILIFSGIVLGLWLSELVGSQILGFGLTTLIIVALFILLAVFRKSLFIDPVVRAVIRRSGKELGKSEDSPVE